MRLVVVGSADAFNSGGRSHSCYWLEADGAENIMIDFGASALMGIHRLGRSGNDLAGVVFTHLHGDHAGGYPFLLIDAMYNAFRSKPLYFLGPTGTEERLDKLLRVAYGDVADNPRVFEVSVAEMRAGETREHLGWKITGFPAEHQDPPEEPLCLVVEGPDKKRIAFSGDTMLRDGLLEAQKDVDLLIAECTAMAHPAGHHCTWEEWEPRLPTLSAKRVMFTHLGEEVRRRAPELVKKVPGVDYGFLDDGMQIDL